MFGTMTIWIGAALAAAGLGGLAYLFAAAEPAPVPTRGPRGAARARTRAATAGFAALEPLLRQMAAHIARWPLGATRAQIDQRLVQGGDWLGLTADEFIALSILSSLAGAGVGAIFVALGVGGGATVAVAVVVGGWLPNLQLGHAIAERFKNVQRNLPAALDLATMCMSAGLDLPGALRQVVAHLPRRDSAIRDEIERILHALSLGHTRRRALEDFAERVPVPAVKDFVGAVVLGEEKGTPLAEVLAIQAGMLRMRRSVNAEEAAAKAGTKMMLPLMMLFGCVFLLLMGPFVIQVMTGGL